jgi:hypothetical protein
MRLLFLLLAGLSMACLQVTGQEKNSPWLGRLLYSRASPFLQSVLNRPDSFHYQLIYTRIDRDKKNRPHFKQYYLRVNRGEYFNPASTVKLPTALCALEKLNQLPITGVNKYTTMLTDSSFSGQHAVYTDTSAASGLPSIAHYIKKIFLISDNDAYNRLYEFTGQQTLNTLLWQKGYKDIRIVRRFVPMTEEENRHTNRIRFVDGRNRLLYEQPAAYDTLPFNFSKQVLVGKGHWDSNDQLVMSPMDFTRHNNLPLEDLQQLLQSVLFPQSVKPEKRFLLTEEDYRFLYQYMSEYPSESRHPRYDTTAYFNSYTKFFLFKAGKSSIPPYIRVFNKTGWSYGYLTDCAYIVDFKNKVEFMLTGTIYTNSDGILNDDKYEYESIGYPFFKETGEIIYRYELERKRKHPPDLGRFQLRYNEQEEPTGLNTVSGAGN